LGSTSRDVHSCSLAETPYPPHLDSYARALLVSEDRRHLFVTPLVGGVGACSSVHTVHCIRCTKPDLNGLAEHGDDEAAVDEVFSSVHISQSDVVVVFPTAHVTHLPRQFYAMLRDCRTRNFYIG
jgi:hypothetical protein